MNIGYDLDSIVPYMAQEVQRMFIRKKFEDFSYLKVEPTMRAVMIAFFITLIINIHKLLLGNMIQKK